MIPSETDFMKITRKMMVAHIMKDSRFCTFQVRIKRFGRVIMSIATRILFLAMIDPIMRTKTFAGRAIALKLIGHQMRSLVNKTYNVWQKIIQLITFYRYSPHRAMAFNRDKHSLFFCSPAAFVFDTAFVSRFAADIFFVQFNNATKRWYKFRSRVHHFPYGMAQLPGAFL